MDLGYLRVFFIFPQ